MGFFDGIVDTVTDIGKSVIGGFSDSVPSIIGGAASSWFDENALKEQNEFNADQAQIARDFNAGQASLAREWADKQAQANRDFQQQLSDTSFQRSVKDMKAAGINPMLAVSKGGASTPVGATATSAAASGPSASAASRTFPSQSVASAMQAVSLVQQAKRAQAETDNIKADTAVKLSEADNADAYFKARATGESAKSYESFMRGQKELYKSDHGGWAAEIAKLKAEIEQSSASAENVKAQNIAIKELMNNPVTKPFAAILQLIMKR